MASSGAGATGTCCASDPVPPGWCSSSSDLELLVEELDACPINGNYWGFFSATANVELAVTVIDTERDVEHQYPNPQGQSADAVTDASAFATCP